MLVANTAVQFALDGYRLNMLLTTTSRLFYGEGEQFSERSLPFTLCELHSMDQKEELESPTVCSPDV